MTLFVGGKCSIQTSILQDTPTLSILLAQKERAKEKV